MLRLGGLLLGGLALACFAAYPYLERLASSASAEAGPGRPQIAEIESLQGEVRVRQHDSVVWKVASVAMPLAEGDLVQTGSSGGARIKFAGGDAVTLAAETIFSLRALAGDAVRLTSSAAAPTPKAAAPVPTAAPPPPPETPASPPPASVAATQAPRPATEPTLEIEKMVWFGRTLQILGRIEPGNSLTINDERVETAGDGTFKHFTSAYPDDASAKLVVFKMKDLAGRVKTVTRAAPAQ